MPGGSFSRTNSPNIWKGKGKGESATQILPPILITHHHSFHSLHPYSISHMGYTRPPWAATRITLHSYSRLDSNPRSSPGYNSVSSRAQGLRRDYNPPTHIVFSPCKCIQPSIGQISDYEVVLENHVPARCTIFRTKV